ncbi:MAG: hypothetical protein FJX52_14270, partial [Alphaproteobacteria bacterium]|nr:hypothetical protein [Alphaproteobacteria bacterium]
MNSAAHAFLILAVIALFIAVVIVPLLARILGPGGFGTGSFGPAPCSPAPCGPIDLASFDRSPRARSPSLPRQGAGPSGPRAAPHVAATPLGDDAELERLIDINRVEGRLKCGSVKKINVLIDRHPQAAASVLRNW